MSGWGCRHQYEEQCLRMHKPCKPGMPGCVLHGKVCFIADVDVSAHTPIPRPSKSGKGRRSKRGG
jgi:hypothetical protein